MAKIVINLFQLRLNVGTKVEKRQFNGKYNLKIDWKDLPINRLTFERNGIGSALIRRSVKVKAKHHKIKRRKPSAKVNANAI